MEELNVDINVGNGLDLEVVFMLSDPGGPRWDMALHKFPGDPED